MEDLNQFRKGEETMRTLYKTGWLTSVIGLALVISACGAAPATTSTGGGTGATKHVAILNKDMTDADIKAEIEKEGSLIVGNWTYTANDELVKQFKQHVKDTYGVDIEFTYEGTQAPNTYLTKLYAAQKAGGTAPYDVLAIEENYWADAMTNDLPDSYLPSDLIPNEKLVL